MPDDELTTDEKQALLKHWLDRGKPTITLGQARWFNLRALLYSSDTYVAQRRRDHTPALRQLLARWNSNHTEVPNEGETIEVRPREQKT
jgi:hypothetical protein